MVLDRVGKKRAGAKDDVLEVWPSGFKDANGDGKHHAFSWTFFVAGLGPTWKVHTLSNCSSFACQKLFAETTVECTWHWRVIDFSHSVIVFYRSLKHFHGGADTPTISEENVDTTWESKLPAWLDEMPIMTKRKTGSGNNGKTGRGLVSLVTKNRTDYYKTNKKQSEKY